MEEYLYYDFEDCVIRIIDGRYFVKFKGGSEGEQFKKNSNLLCDALLDSNTKHISKEAYDKF